MFTTIFPMSKAITSSNDHGHYYHRYTRLLDGDHLWRDLITFNKARFIFILVNNVVCALT
jgi:hypothetical protein